MDNPYGSPLRLRNLPTYTAEQEFQDDNANASVLRRSFLNTLTTEDAGRRRQDELEAQVAGDERAAAEAAYLRNVARGRQLAIEGPTTLREVYENDGAGAGTYLQNVVGSMAGSMLPSLAAGAAGTAVAGPVGGIVGAGLASYSSIRPAELEQYAADPEISELSPERQLEMSRNSAALQALPEALLPAYLTAGGRLPAAMLRMPTPARLGAASIGEGVTEGVQDQISQRVVQNEFPDRQIDWEQTGEAVAAGVIGGGVTTAVLGGGPGEAPQPRTDGIPLNGAPPPVVTPPTGPVPLNPGTPPPVVPPADPAPNQPVPGGPPVPLNPKSKTPVTDQLVARAEELGPDAAPEQLLETPDMRDAALLGPETADPWVLRAPDAATAVRDREETLTNRAFVALGDVLATPGVPEAVRTQMLQMVDPTTQAIRPEMRQQAIQLAADLRTKNTTASVIDQLADRDEGVVQKNNLMSLPTTELKPLIAQLAKRLPDDRRNEAPTLARQLVAGVTRKLSDKTLNSLQQLDAELVDTLTAVADSPELTSAVEKIRNQNSALNDLRRSRTEKGASFFESMLAPNLPPQYVERAARVVDEIADSGLDNMTEQRRANVLKALTPVFGSDQNTRAVIEYYGNVRREDKAAISDDADTTADSSDDTDTTGYAPGVGFVDTELDGLDDGEVDIGAPMSEVDPSKPRYAFRDAKAARPFDVDVIPNFQRSKVTYTPEENAPYENVAADILAAVDRAVSRVQTDPELRKRPAVRDATSTRLERTRAIVSRWYDKYGARAVVELLDTSKNRRRHAGAFEALNRIKSGTPDTADAEFITLTQYLDETAGGVAAAEKRKLAREQGKEAGLSEAQINRMLAEVDNDDAYAVELNRRRRDIEDRLEDARRNNKTAQVERLENMLAMVELTAEVRGQEAALDLFEVISVRNRDQNDLIATDEQIRKFGALLKAKDPKAQKTKVNFIDPDGREVSLSAESIYKTIGEERGVTSATTSQDRAKQLFADGVASLLARGYKLAPGTNLSKVLVDRQMGVYADKTRSPERLAALREERDRFNQSVAELREQLQTADTVGAKLYRAVARSAQRGGKVMSTRRRDQLHAQLIARRDQLRAPITKYETELAAWEAKLAAAKAAGEDFRVTDAMQSRKPVPPPKAVYDRLVRPNDVITLTELDMFEAIQKDFDAALDAKHEPKSAFVKNIVAPARQIVARRSAELSSMREQTRRLWEEYFNTKDTDAYNAAREAQARVDLADDQLRGMRDALTKMGDTQWLEQWELDDNNRSGVIEQDEDTDIKAIRNRDTNIEDFVDEYSMTIATRAKDFVPLREDFETMDAAQADKVLEFMSLGELAQALSQAQKDLAAIPEGDVVSARQRERIAMLQGALKRRYQVKAAERKRVRRWETLSRGSDGSGTQMELPLGGSPKASTAKVTPPQGVDAPVNAVANPDQGDLFETPSPSFAQQLQSRGWVRKAQTPAAQQERTAPEEGLPKKRSPLQEAALDVEMAAADVNASQAAVGGRIKKEGGTTVRIAKQELIDAKLRLQGMLGRPPAATERMSSVFARAEKAIERLLANGQTEKAEQLRAQLEAAKASVRKADAARAAQAERDRQDRVSEPTELDKAIAARRAADAERRAKREEAAPTKLEEVKPAIEVWWGTPSQRQNGELSNLAPRPFTINGRDYKSVEHAYQTLKSGAFDETTYNAYLQPGASAKIRGRPAKTEGDWNLQLMKKLMLASFRQNPDAAQKLLDTGDAPITHVRGGPIWAKEFPRILGEVRSELQNGVAAPTKQSAATAAPNDSIRKFSRVGFARSQLERSISVMENQAAKKFFTAIGFKEGDLPAGEGVDILNKLIAAAGDTEARRHLNQSALAFASKLYTKQLTEAQFASLTKLAATTPEWVSDEFAELHAKIRLARQAYKPKVASRHNVELVNAVLAKYVGYAIRDRLPGASNKPLFARIKEWFRKAFGETNPAVELFKSEGQRIAASMLTGDLDFFAGKIGPDKRKLDFSTLLDDPAVAFESGAIRLLSAAGYTLTGSAALSPQGDIWRSGGSPLHDVDFVAPAAVRTMEESLALISKTLRLDTGRVHHIQRMDPAGTWLDRFLVTKRPGLKLVNVGPRKGGYPSHYEVVDEKTGKVVEWYENRTGNAEGERFFDGDNKPKKSGQLSTIIDVFKPAPDRVTYMEPAGKYKVRISDWRTILEAKLAFDRSKDLSDFARFKPNRSEVMEEGAAPMTAAERQALRDELTKLRGPDVELRLDKLISQLGGSGLHEFAPSTGDRLIEVAVNAKNPIGVLRHEALHDLFATFNETPEMRSVVADIERASGSLHVMSQLKKLLANHPEALAQLADPEERAAYAFQFWAEGQLTMTDKGNRIFEAIRQFLKDVFGLVSEGQRAEHLFEAFRDGKFKDPGTAQLALQDIRDKRGDLLRNKFQRAAPKVAEAFDKLLTTAPDRLRELRNPAITQLADLFHPERGKAGFISKLIQRQGVWQNRLYDVLKDTTAAERMAALRELQAMNPQSALAKKVSDLTRKFYDEARAAGVQTWDADKKQYVPLRRVQNYFPRAWDPDAIARDRDGFVQLLVTEGGMTTLAAGELADSLISGFENRPTPEDDKVLGFSPYAPGANARILTFIKPGNASKFSKFQYQDLTDTLQSYIKSMAHRTTYTEIFGHDGKKIRDLIMDSRITDPKELEGIFNTVQAMEGTLDPGQWSASTKKGMSAVMAVQNFVLLPLSIFSQMIDPIIMAARTGSIRDAGSAYMTAITRLASTITKSNDKVAGEDLAHILGIVSQDDTLQSMMMSYGPTVKMGSWTDRASRFFFKWNGLQGWNNSMRIAATAAGERFFLANKDNAEFLQEFGLRKGDIKDNNGALDVTSPRVKQAMFRFVDQAVLRPTPALRPVWMSDPRFMLVAHLKQFTFAMHKVVLGRATRELNNDNVKPWATLMLAMPTVLAADMTKYALMGNMPTDWTFMDYLQHAVERSGLLGIGDFAVQATDRVEMGAAPGEALLGPAFENLMEILRYVTGDTQTSFDSVIDRTVPGARFITPNSQEGTAQ